MKQPTQLFIYLVCKPRSSRIPDKVLGLCILYLSILLIANAGDVELNPGPKPACGLCDKTVRINQRGICCDSCNIWFHTKCLNLSSTTYKAIQSSNLSWICCSCGLPNFASSLFDDSSSLECSNSFSSLSSLQDTSLNNNTFSPTITSSPKNQKPRSQNRRKNNYNSKRQNQKLKAVVINFQGLRSKVESLAALINTSSPDIIFGTETWANNTITNAELFPSHFDVYDIWRKDRPDGYGGVLLAVKKRSPSYSTTSPRCRL